jgi:hypothetical protein
MANHSGRDHATWSASATERNWNCPGALALTAHLPEKTSEAADWGTACHQISEKCLRGGMQPAEFIGTTEKGKVHSFEVDEEMAETAEMYVTYVRQAAIEAAGDTYNPANLLQIEQKFSLASLTPPFEAGGTGDAVVYFPAKKMIEVIDLKGGRGKVVEVEGNPQLRTYALGAMLANTDLAVTTVKVTIIQPRAPHKDGRIRSDEFHVSDLFEWTTELLAAMRRSREASDRRGDANEAAWAAEFLKPGDHCGGTFCKAQGFCPALERRSLDAAQVWFDDFDQPRISNSPDSMSVEKLSQTLDMLDMISDWVNAVRAYAHDQAESGVELPNYILVEKQGREKWNEGAEQRAAQIAINAGVDGKKVWNDPKIRTPKQVREALAKLKNAAALAEIKALSSTPTTGTNLVRVDKTTRPAVASAAARHFEIFD